MESNVSSHSKKNLSLNDINQDEKERFSTTTTMFKSTSKEARDSSYDIARLNENNETTNELLECWYRSEEGPERIGTNRIVPCEIREDASALRKSGDIERDEYEDEKVRLKSDVKSINRSNDELSLKRNDSHCDQPRDPTNVKSNSTILRQRGMTDAIGVAVASSPSCGMTFRKANDNPTNQRWSGFDRGSVVNRCYTVRSSRSRVSGSRGSTYPYSPTLQTREASSKCYNVPKDPIVRSNIIGSASRILRTRNSVTGSAGVGTDCSGYMTTRNIDNPKLYSNVDTANRIFLGSKSSTGLYDCNNFVSFRRRRAFVPFFNVTYVTLKSRFIEIFREKFDDLLRQTFDPVNNTIFQVSLRPNRRSLTDAAKSQDQNVARKSVRILATSR